MHGVVVADPPVLASAGAGPSSGPSSVVSSGSAHAPPSTAAAGGPGGTSPSFGLQAGGSVASGEAADGVGAGASRDGSEEGAGVQAVAPGGAVAGTTVGEGPTVSASAGTTVGEGPTGSAAAPAPAPAPPSAEGAGTGAGAGAGAGAGGAPRSDSGTPLGDGTTPATATPPVEPRSITPAERRRMWMESASASGSLGSLRVMGSGGGSLASSAAVGPSTPAPAPAVPWAPAPSRLPVSVTEVLSPPPAAAKPERQVTRSGVFLVLVSSNTTQAHLDLLSATKDRILTSLKAQGLLRRIAHCMTSGRARAGVGPRFCVCARAHSSMGLCLTPPVAPSPLPMAQRSLAVVACALLARFQVYCV